MDEVYAKVIADRFIAIEQRLERLEGNRSEDKTLLRHNDEIWVMLTEEGKRKLGWPTELLIRSSVWVFAAQLGPHMRGGQRSLFEWIQPIKSV